MEILTFGNEILTQKNINVDNFDLSDTINSMVELIKNKGIGLAAPQVGINKRFFITYINDIVKEYINPRILAYSGATMEMEEGCLSFPGTFLRIKRPANVLINYYDLDKNLHSDYATGIESRVIQHEYDHIEGILFIKYINFEERRRD